FARKTTRDAATSDAGIKQVRLSKQVDQRLAAPQVPQAAIQAPNTHAFKEAVRHQARLIALKQQELLVNARLATGDGTLTRTSRQLKPQMDQIRQMGLTS